MNRVKKNEQVFTFRTAVGISSINMTKMIKIIYKNKFVQFIMTNE